MTCIDVLDCIGGEVRSNPVGLIHAEEAEVGKYLSEPVAASRKEAGVYPDV